MRVTEVPFVMSFVLSVVIVPCSIDEGSAIVSPEDFERFQKGEMTKEELLSIKKAVDKVTEAKKKSC